MTQNSGPRGQRAGAGPGLLGTVAQAAHCTSLLRLHLSVIRDDILSQVSGRRQSGGDIKVDSGVCATTTPSPGRGQALSSQNIKSCSLSATKILEASRHEPIIQTPSRKIATGSHPAPW